MNNDLYRGIEDLGPDLAAAFDVTTLDREFYENPYPVFHALRRHVPVHKMPSGAWFLTRHADLDFAYHDPVLFSSDKTVDFRKTMGETSLYEHHTTSLVFNDPPEHTRVRKRLAPAFTPRALRALESRVVEVVDASLDGVAEMGSFDARLAMGHRALRGRGAGAGGGMIEGGREGGREAGREAGRGGGRD